MRQPPLEIRAAFREASVGEPVLAMWWTHPHSQLEGGAAPCEAREGVDRLVALARIDLGLERVAAGPVGAPAAAHIEAPQVTAGRTTSICAHEA